VDSVRIEPCHRHQRMWPDDYQGRTTAIGAVVRVVGDGTTHVRLNAEGVDVELHDGAADATHDGRYYSSPFNGGGARKGGEKVGPFTMPTSAPFASRTTNPGPRPSMTPSICTQRRLHAGRNFKLPLFVLHRTSPCADPVIMSELMRITPVARIANL